MAIDLKQAIQEKAKQYFADTRKLRRQLHAHPELSFCEVETATLIDKKLTEWGIEHQTEVGGHGVVAVIKGNNPVKRCIALRADMDALPIEEANDCEYKSQQNGAMHACGHDAHTAMLLSVARILNELKNDLEGTIKLVFQPAEEKLPGGAKAILASGVLDDVDCIVAQHVYPDLACGEVGFCEGAFMASCDEIEIEVKGRGGHAAKPAERDDMILIASEMMVQLQKVNSKVKPKNTQSILAFGRFIADGTYNVIADTVNMKGTFRTFDENWRAMAKRIIKETVFNVATENKVKVKTIINEGYPFLNNNADITEECRQAANTILGSEHVHQLPQLMTAEDFAWYSQKIPVCFFRLGTTTPNTAPLRQHTPTFNIDEEAMETGTSLMAWIAASILS